MMSKGNVEHLSLSQTESINKTPSIMDDDLAKPHLGGDDLDIQGMGYTVELQDRPFNILNIFAIGFTICNSAIAVIASLATGIGNGGPITYIWAQIFIYAMSFCVAVSLGELASAMPNAGGQYYWASQLAPKKIHATVSYVVGMVSWVASVFICASVTLVIPQMAAGMMVLTNPNLVVKPWMVWIGFQVTNLFVFGFNCFSRILPVASQCVLTMSLCAIIIIFVSVLASSPHYRGAEFVFATFVNKSGWSSPAITVFTGAVGVNWGFSCLDAVTHLAEEIPNPRKNVPKALLGTVIVGMSTAFPITLAILFCIQDIDAIISTPTLVASLEFFRQAMGSNSGAIGLQCLVLVSTCGSLWGCHAWQSRLAWSFARDHGLPFSKYIGHIAGPPFGVPLAAHAWSCFWVGVLGCLYLGSTVAFNSFVGGAIMMQYMTYSTCIILLLLKGRSTFRHGPFWFKRFGPIANFVTIGWTIFTTIFYSFPPYLPVEPNTMNYVSVVIVGIFLIVAAWYMLATRKIYTPPPRLDATD